MMRCIVAAAVLCGTMTVTMAQGQTKPSQLIGAQIRADYADRLRRSFLSIGLSMSVMSWETQPKSEIRLDSLKRYPKLVIFGYLDDSAVYRIMTEGGVLKNARAIGYSGIEFMTKGPGGRWLYDITGTEPHPCDISRRVCL
jgi:hypothetical protein